MDVDGLERAERLLDLGKRLVGADAPAEQTSNGRALMVIKDAAIADKMKACGITLRQSYGRSCSYDEGAMAAGRRAGNGASFGRPVEGAAGAPRIGRG
jgi:hypothetical protein